MKQVLALSLLASIVAISGCVNDKTVKVESDVKSNQNQVISEIKKIKLPDKNSHVFVENRAWLPSVTNLIKKNASWVRGEESIGMSGKFRSFADFAGRVTSLTGIKIELAPEVFETSSSSSPSPSSSPSLSMGGVGAGAGAGAQTKKINIDYEGTVSGLLDAATSQAGLYWEVNPDNTVRIAKFDSKTWRISALIGDLTQTSSVVNGTSKASFAVSGASIWTSFNDGIESLLSQNGQVFVSESLGTVTVTDTPSVLSTVDRFVKQQNKSLSKSVLVNLKIYVVKINDSDDYGVDWNMLYNSINATQTGLSSALMNTTLSPAGSSKLSLGILGSNSEFNGSKLLLQALSKRGHVSEVRDTRQLTLNGQPVPFKEGREIAYLKSSDTTITNGVATTASSQGVVSTGFFLNVVPHVLDDGQSLLLQVALNMTTLDKMNTVSSGESTIQTPETSSREMIQRVKLQTGDTLVITGFDASDLRSTLGGVGSAENNWLGGSTNSNSGRTMMVVLVQPVVGND